jgi:hypothetical protein
VPDSGCPTESITVPTDGEVTVVSVAVDHDRSVGEDADVTRNELLNRPAAVPLASVRDASGPHARQRLLPLLLRRSEA